MASATEPGRARLTIYALPGLVFAAPTIPAYVYLPAFYADAVGLGLGLTGAVLLGSRLLDVATDPLVGWACDRVTARGWRRKPWILAGAALAGLALLRLVDPPAGAGAGWLLGWSVLLYLGWTLIAVPYAAWGAELADDYHRRSRVTAAREAMMLAGILIAGAAPAFLGEGAELRAGLLAVAWGAVLVGAPAVAALLIAVPEAAPRPALRRPRLRAQIARVAGNAPFRRLIAAWFVNGLANGIPAALFPLFLEHGLRADANQRGLLISAYFAAAIAATPLWLVLSRRFGKHRAWCAAMMLACAAFVWTPALGPGDLAPFLAICVVTGMALGADLALPPSLQADIADYHELRTGRAETGLLFALWSMATKLALAASVGVAFPALAALGFDPARDNAPAALAGLAMVYALAPAALKLGAVALVWSHPITPRRHAAIRRRLAARAGQDSVRVGDAGAAPTPQTRQT